MRNRLEMEKVLDAAYGIGPQRPPNGDGVLPPLLPKVLPLHQVIPVDGFLPGCPPSAGRIWEAICALLPPLPATAGPVTGPVAGDERSMS
jgi:NAD-reducing hydrogenase small subunit